MNIKRFYTYLFFLSLFLSQTITAQFFYFGRNKVHYEDFDWKILQTDHFDIYYYDDMQNIAEIGAKYAEEIYTELKVEMNHVVTRRVPLIFYNTSLEFQQTNTSAGLLPDGVGGFFEFLKGRVVLPANGSLKDFRHVIRHEIVHVFMTNKVYWVFRDHKQPKHYLAGRDCIPGKLGRTMREKTKGQPLHKVIRLDRNTFQSPGFYQDTNCHKSRGRKTTPIKSCSVCLGLVRSQLRY